MEGLSLQSSENVKCVIAMLAIGMLNLISSNWKYVTSGYVADIKVLFRCCCKPASNFYRTLSPNCYLQRLKSFNVLMNSYKIVAPYWEIIRNCEALTLILDRQNIVMTFSRFFPPLYTEILKLFLQILICHPLILRPIRHTQFQQMKAVIIQALYCRIHITLPCTL